MEGQRTQQRAGGVRITGHRPPRARRGGGPPRGPSGAVAGRRGDILDAALEVFTKWGYHRATIEEIRALSGASIGRIYHHIGGKEQLAAALYLEGLADYQRSYSRTLQRTEGTEATVRAIVRNHLDWVRANPYLAAFLLTTRETDLREATDRGAAVANRRLIEMTRSWIDASGVRPMSTKLFYAIVIGPAQEFARQWVHDLDDGSMKEALSELPEAAWRAVGP